MSASFRDAGIVSFGGYVPRQRIARRVLADAGAWFNPSLAGASKGDRAFAGWDEDSVTMAVEAARACLAGIGRESLRACYLASTTLPFADRLNAGVLAAALGLADRTAMQDLAGSQRAATSGLYGALDVAAAGSGPVLVTAADRRRTRPAGPQEMSYGDGAAAILVGTGELIARCLARRTAAADFVDHFRAHDARFDYAWEERWIRDEGYLKIAPPVIAGLLADAGVEAGAVDHVCLSGPLARAYRALAKKCGLREDALANTLAERCGDAGAAHPLLSLAAALERAEPGERILVLGFGQGCDAFLFETTDRIAGIARDRGVAASLERGVRTDNYARFLTLSDLLPVERGMRAELDKATPLSSLYRNSAMLTGLVGGRCRKCGTLQYPRMRVCVGEGCGATDSQDEYRFSEETGFVRSYTADRLTYCPDPPQIFGMIEFAGGGRMMMDFTDIDADEVEVGAGMRMVFRIKDIDTARGFTRYFWKAAPSGRAAGE